VLERCAAKDALQDFLDFLTMHPLTKAFGFQQSIIDHLQYGN
jgi:hypothetical protein